MRRFKAKTYAWTAAALSLSAAACKSDSPPGPPKQVTAPIGGGGLGTGSFGTGLGTGSFGSGSLGTGLGTGSFGTGLGTGSSGLPADPNSFLGNWVTPCVPDPATSGRSSLQQWMINSGQFSYTYKQFGDAACTLPDLTQTRTGQITFAGSSTTLTSAALVNIQIASESTLIQSAARAQAWNAQTFCQANNWQFSASYDTLKCEATQLVYDLWQIQTNGQMAQGLNDAGHGGNSVATRPVAVNTNALFQHSP